MRTLKKSAQFELIFMQNNSNNDLTKELNKTEFCLKKLRTKYPKNILFRHLNINSLRNKFEYLEETFKNMFDVFLISECKLYLSFPDTQFQVANYNMFQKDRNKNDSVLLF